MDNRGVSTYKIDQLWTDDAITFFETAVGQGGAGNVLRMDTKQITVGDAAQDIDFKIFLGTSAYALFDAGASTVTLSGLDVTITGDLTIDTEDIALGDNDSLEFGDGTDVTITWVSASSILQISPATDNVGSINIGDGTADIDLKIFMGAAGTYVLFDNNTAIVDLTGVKQTITRTNPTAAENGFYALTNSGGATGWTGTVVPIRGKQSVTNTGTTIGNSYGGWFGLTFATGMTADRGGLSVGLYAESENQIATRCPNSVAYFQSVISAAGDQSAMPILVLTSTGGTDATKAGYAFSLGHAAAATTVSNGSGYMYYNNTIKILANGDTRYIPLSTAEGTYTTAYLIAANGGLTMGASSTLTFVSSGLGGTDSNFTIFSSNTADKNDGIEFDQTCTGTKPGTGISYWRSAEGAVATGEDSIALKVTSEIDSSTDLGGVVAGSFLARSHSGNTGTCVNVRGLLSEARARNTAVTSAYGLESTITVDAACTVTTATVLHVALWNSGTVTTSYGVYIEGGTVAGDEIGTGIYMTQVVTGISIAADAVTGILIGACATGISTAAPIVSTSTITQTVPSSQIAATTLIGATLTSAGEFSGGVQQGTLIGLKVAVTGTGTFGMDARAIYASYTTVGKVMTGFFAAGAFEIFSTNTTDQCDSCVIDLRDHDDGTAGHPASSYIRLRVKGDQNSAAGRRNFVNFYNESSDSAYDSGRMVAATSNTSASSIKATHLVRCFMDDEVLYLMATTTAPLA